MDEGIKTESRTRRRECDESQDEVSIVTTQDYLISIENTIANIADGLGSDVATFYLRKHGGSSVEDVSPSEYSALFDEIFQVEADMKD